MRIKKKKLISFDDLEKQEKVVENIKENLGFKAKAVVEGIIDSCGWVDVYSDRIIVYLEPDCSAFFDDVEEISVGFERVFGDKFKPFYFDYEDDQGFLRIVFLRNPEEITELNLNEEDGE